MRTQKAEDVPQFAGRVVPPSAEKRQQTPEEQQERLEGELHPR